MRRPQARSHLNLLVVGSRLLIPDWPIEYTDIDSIAAHLLHAKQHLPR